MVTLDKRPEVRPVGIGETLRRALAKLVMRVAGAQSKTSCGNLQLCADLEAVIEGESYAVVQTRLERARQIWSKEEARRPGEGEDEDEAAGEELLTVDIEGMEEEAADILEEVLGMGVKE